MTCHDCGRPLVAKKHPAPEGHARHAGRGLCLTCYSRSRYVARTQGVASRDNVIDDVRTLQWRTDDPQRIADALGISVAGVAQALYRAGRPDLARPFWRAQDRLRSTP